MNDYERFGDYQPSERSRVGTALTFLFIGLGAGALAALLFAPKTGKQMRRTIRRTYGDAREAIEDWTDQAGDMIDKGTDWANKAKDRGAEWASTAKDRIEPIAKKMRR